MQISEKELSQIRKLKSRKGRNEQFRFLVEGVRAARELFSSDIQVEKIMVCKDCLTGTGREFLHTLGGVADLPARCPEICAAYQCHFLTGDYCRSAHEEDGKLEIGQYP